VVKRDQIANIIRFTQFRNVPRATELKLLKYFDARYSITEGQEDTTVLSQLPYQMRMDVVGHIYRDTLSGAPFFTKVTDECASTLLLHMRAQICLDGDSAVVPGQVFDDMMFLMRGAYKVHGEAAAGQSKAKQNWSFTMVERLGQSVGGMSLCGYSPRAPYRITATKKSHMVCISNTAIGHVLSMFPANKPILLAFIDQEHKQLLQTLQGGSKRKTTEDGESPRASPRAGNSPVATTPVASRRAVSETEAESTLTSALLKERVVALDQQVERVSRQIGEMQKDLAAMPAIIKLLQTASVNVIAS